jgi:nucleoside-diphosphate-sugar epimerase
MSFGPIIVPTQDIFQIGPRLASVYRLMNENVANPGETSFSVSIDARDAARVHVRAYEEAGVSNQRDNVSSGTFTHQQWVDIMGNHFPSLEDRLPKGRLDKRVALGMDHSKAVRDLIFALRPLEKTVVDTVHRFLQIEQVR